MRCRTRAPLARACGSGVRAPSCRCLLCADFLNSPHDLRADQGERTVLCSVALLRVHDYRQIQWGNCNFNLRILGIVNLLARWGPLGGGIERRYVCVRAPLNRFFRTLERAAWECTNARELDDAVGSRPDPRRHISIVRVFLYICCI